MLNLLFQIIKIFCGWTVFPSCYMVAGFGYIAVKAQVFRDRGISESEFFES